MATTNPAAPARGRHTATPTPRTRALTERPAVRRAVLGVAAATLPIGLGIGAPAFAGAEVGGSGDTFFLQQTASDSVAPMDFGREGDEVHVGDFTGNGADSLMVRRDNAMHIAASATDTTTSAVVHYGTASDTALVGDWDGDGTDTYAVRRGNEYLLTNSPDGSTTDLSVTFGRADDAVLVGDWDGDGVDSLAVRRNGNEYFFSSSIGQDVADHALTFGRPSDSVVVGDWNGDGTDTLGVHRANIFLLSGDFTGGDADRSFTFGRPGDHPLAGDWNGDGTDTVAVRRPEPKPEPAPAPAPAPNPYAVTGVWARLAQCESGGNPRIVSANGLYYGLYQFSLSTWRSVGGQGLPSNASPEEQTMRAQILQARSGWGQWPACSRMLGLR